MTREAALELAIRQTMDMRVIRKCAALQYVTLSERRRVVRRFERIMGVPPWMVTPAYAVGETEVCGPKYEDMPGHP